MPGIHVDGMDVFAVYDATAQAVARARAGEGPTLIECETYRYYGHTVFERSMELQRPWAAALGRNLTASQVREVCATLEELLTALKGSEEAGPDATTP